MLGKKVTPALEKLKNNFIEAGGTFQKYIIGDIFEAQNGDFDIQQKHINNKGYYVVSSGEQNTGIIGKTDIPSKIFDKNTITIDMFGNAYFRDFNYKMVTHARVFSLKYKFRELTRLEGIYFVSQFSYFKKLFSYSNMASFSKIKDIAIKLPTLKDGKIDFEFIRAYISELEEERISELTAYLAVSGLDNYKLTSIEKQSLHNLQGGVTTASFKIGDLFDIETGRDVIINQVINGSIPLISHQHANNGISKYIKRLNNRKLYDYQTTIPVADRGVFLATTQTKNFHIGTRVKALTFKSGQQKEEIRLYFVSAINKLQILFDEYLNNATDKLPNLEIQLPINSNNEIDYEFIENYIKAIEKLCIKAVIEWKDCIIEETKKIVYM